MKFTDYLFAPGVRPTSIFIGVLIGSGTALFTDWMMGVFVGAVAVLILSFVIPLTFFLQDIPYNRVKKTLPKPFLFDERVRFTAKGGTVAGYFILTEDRMIFLSMEKGKHRMELSREDVVDVRSDDRFFITIYLNQKEYVRVQTPVFKDVLRVLGENGWR